MRAATTRVVEFWLPCIVYIVCGCRAIAWLGVGNVKTVILAGTTTSGVVLVERVFPASADVVSTAQLTARRPQ